MGLNAAGINALLEDGNEAVMWVALGDGPTAADQVSNERRQLTSTVSGGVITGTGVPYSFTGTASSPVTHSLLFSASTAGTFYGFDAVSGDATFNSEGAYQLTGVTVTGSSPA